MPRAGLDLLEHPWLVGPVGDRETIGDRWIDAEVTRLGATAIESGGLLANVAKLAGPGFDPAALAESVVDFYERTSDWRLDVWSQRSPAAWPVGWLLSTLFAHRLAQLALPLRPLEVAKG